MKQTASEWLYERLERMIPRSALYDIDKREYFKQAKQIEKQQIIEARVTAPLLDTCSKNEYIIEAEQYYNETFNKDE
jgi:hypothetical protein